MNEENAMLDDLISRLDELYSRLGIHPTDFRCGHRAQCSQGLDDFTEARMPSIGDRYLDASTPRIAVVSLDSGSGEQEAANRLVRIQRRAEEELGHRNKHWYRTHEIVMHLVRPFETITESAATEHFIHLNSAKCSANLPGRKQAPWRMFMNCRWYLPEEIRVVAPEVIVTQGDRARDALWGAFPVKRIVGAECKDESHRCWAGVIYVEGVGPVLWLHTYHPNQPGGLYHRSLEGYRRCYPRWVSHFVSRGASRET